MGFNEFTSLVTLTALVIASSILSVGSLRMANAVAGEMFRRREANPELFVYSTDQCQRIRDKIQNYPGKLLFLYLLCSFLLITILTAYTFVIQVKGDFVAVKFGLPLEFAEGVYAFAQNLPPFCLMFYMGFAVYVVSQTISICKKYFSHRSD